MRGTFLERFFSLPAEALDVTVRTAAEEEHMIAALPPVKATEAYLETLGPGITTGAADDDPSGIATYSQAGAAYGFQLLWLSLFTFPLMAIVQEMCARIGIVTGRGLAANIKHGYSKNILYVICALLFAANTFNIAADLGAMAASTQLLLPGFTLIELVIGFAVVSGMLQIYLTYKRYAQLLKYFTLALLSYVFTAFAVHLPWVDALYHTVVPSISFTQDQIVLVCAILGTTISPYLFFWQTSQEVEELALQHAKRGAPVLDRETKLSAELRRMRIDVWSGMGFSNLVMFFIIAACGATLYAHGITDIQSAEQAAQAIRPFGGDLTYALFALGVIGTGMLAIPVLAGSSAYALSEAFGWKHGLNRPLAHATAFYGVIIVSLAIGALANLLGVNPIRMLVLSAVCNGVIAPFILFFIVALSIRLPAHNTKPVMAVVGYAITAALFVVGCAALYQLF